MSAMFELHAEVQLALSAPAAEAVRSAMSEVKVRAVVAERCDDLDTARKALREVTWAAMRAAEILNTVERETREAAIYAAEHRSAA